MTGKADAFHLSADLVGFEGEDRVFAWTWSKKVPRDMG